MDFGARLWAGLATGLAGGLAATGAAAATGQPEPYQLNLQDPVTPLAEQIHVLNNGLLIAMTVITAFVLALLLYVMLRFNARANPTPSHFHHNTLLEVAWTVIPILILVVIAIPSFRLLYNQYTFPKPDLTIKVVGHQWYWSYEYADTPGVAYDSFMLDDKGREAMKAKGLEAPRLLAVDNEIVVPLNKVVHILSTSGDVIHNWTIPAFGVKLDAVPGRVAAAWFQVTRPGVYYGPCSELCGKDHAYMPIAVRVVSEEVFAKWLAARKAGGNDVDDKARAVLQQATADAGGKVLALGSAQ